MLDSSGNVYSAMLQHNGSTLAQLLLREKGSNMSSTPFQGHTEGSATQELMPDTRDYVYYVFRHHAYIASGQDVIILNLNSHRPVYDKINIGRTPLQIKAYDYGGQIYLFVVYQENNRDYIVTHRKYQDGGWGRYGRPLLVTSPLWYNLDKISNIMIFQAQDTQFSYSTVYVAVGIGWSIHVCEIIDGSYFTLSVPKPCNNITRLNFNEKRQTMFIECLEGTMYYDFNDYNYYQNNAWDETFGTTQFSSDGRYGAIVSNISAQVSMVTVIDLKWHDNYEFDFFRVISHTSRIIQSEFVTPNASTHYFCYVENGSNSRINCLHVELGMQNQAIPGIAIRQLPNTRGICGRPFYCRGLYAHHNLLAVNTQRCIIGDSCLNVLLMFDMSSLTNTWNISGIEADFIAWKPDHHVPNVTASTPTPYYPTSHSTSPPNSTQPPNSTPTPEFTPVSKSTSTARPSATTKHSTSPPSSSQPSSQETSEATTDNLQTCQRELESTNNSYKNLLWIVISISVSFSLAMIVAIVLFIAIACISVKRPTHHNPKPCNKCAHQLPTNK